MSKAAKWIAVFSLILIIMAIIFFSRKPERIYYTKPCSRKITSILALEGDLVSRNVMIYYSVPGKLKQIKQVNSRVEKGDILFEIESRELEKNINILNKKLDQALIGLDILRKELNSAEALLDVGGISQAEVNRLRYQFKNEETGVKILREELDTLLETKQELKVSAPFNGLVIYSSSAPDTIQVPGRKIMEFADTDSLIIKSTVSQSTRPLIEPGMKVNIYSEPDSISDLKGRISSIKPVQSADLQIPGSDSKPEIEFELVVEFNHDIPDSMTYGSRLSLDVIRACEDVSAAIPMQAVVFTETGKNLVFKITPDFITPVRIETGIMDDEYIQIKKGLTPDDKVVLFPARWSLSPDQPVPSGKFKPVHYDNQPEH